MAEAAIICITKFQQTVAMISTKAEFVAASEAGKFALSIFSLLTKLGQPQEHAIIMYKDNVGAFLMAEAGQPTTVFGQA